MSTDTLMNTCKAADYLGLTELTVRRLARNGQVPAAKIGRSYRFKREDIDEYLRQQYRHTIHQQNEEQSHAI